MARKVDTTRKTTPKTMLTLYTLIGIRSPVILQNWAFSTQYAVEDWRLWGLEIARKSFKLQTPDLLI